MNTDIYRQYLGWPAAKVNRGHKGLAVDHKSYGSSQDYIRASHGRSYAIT